MYRHILVGFNGTAGATRALHAALDLARPGDGEVRVLCVAESRLALPPVSGWELELDRLGRASAAGSAHGVPVRLAVATGRCGPAIVRFAARQHSDLVVVGRRAGGHRCGGTAGHVGRRAPCPVLIVA